MFDPAVISTDPESPFKFVTDLILMEDDGYAVQASPSQYHVE
jgi:hypothetical protein